MHDQILKNKLFQSVEKLEKARGHHMTIKEVITRTKNRSFDRHSSTTTIMNMTLESSGWAISGGKLMLLGSRQQQYEVCFDLVVECDIEQAKISFVEVYTKNHHRHTMISIESKL